MFKMVTLLLILGMLISCYDADDDLVLNGNSFLVFGHFYGECSGEGCVETYKLTDASLYEDILDDYSGSHQEFVELENTKFEQVKDVIDFFPNRLLNEQEPILGCPDCADGGGIFIQYSIDGTIKSWRIDQTLNNVPEYLHEFIEKVNEKIALINN